MYTIYGCYQDRNVEKFTTDEIVETTAENIQTNEIVETTTENIQTNEITVNTPSDNNVSENKPLYNNIINQIMKSGVRVQLSFGDNYINII